MKARLFTLLILVVGLVLLLTWSAAAQGPPPSDRELPGRGPIQYPSGQGIEVGDKPLPRPPSLSGPLGGMQDVSADDPALILGGGAVTPPPDGTDNELQRDTQPPDSIIITLHTPPYQVTTGGDGFDLVQVEGFDFSGSPGDPALPGKVYNIAIPPGVAWESVIVESLKAETVDLPGTYESAPVPPPVTWVDGQEIVTWGENAASILDGRNTKVYQKDSYFPSSYVTLVAQSQMRKWRFVRLLFTPVQYNPVTGKLRMAAEVEVRVAFERVSATQAQQIQAELSDTAMDDRARQILYNYDQAKSWYRTDNPLVSTATDADYVIITSNAIVAGSSKLNGFIAHQQARGHMVEVVTETQYGGLTGQPPNSTAEKIRQWLINNYLTKHIRYVLLIGNPDPDDLTLSDSVGDVPMKMCWPRHGLLDHEEAPTDYFYADLTGNWDLDGDLYFGEYNGDRESGGVDFAPEVYVGRIPVYRSVSGWATTLDSILQKIMDYDNASDLAWRRSALLPMSFLDSETDGAFIAERMKSDYLNEAGFASYTMYQHRTTGCNSGYSSNQDLVDGAVRAHWQNNAYGLVAWSAHGGSSGAYIGYSPSCSGGTLLTSSNVSSLDNGHPAVVFQNSCSNGLPESSTNLGYALLKNGAVATVPASRVTYYNPGIWSPSRAFADTNSVGYYFMQRVTNGELAGEAFYDEKGVMGPGWGESTWMNLMVFSLYGDPSTSISGIPAPWSDSMESGINGWIYDGLWHQVQDGLSPYPNSHSPSHSWWYGQDSTGDYDTGVANSGSLTTPSIFIPSSISSPKLSFWYWYETETSSADWDQRWIQISINGGAFQNLAQLSGDTMQAWNRRVIDLAAYKGQTVRVRFYFDTKDAWDNTYRGWYVDDVQVDSSSTVNTVYLPLILR